MGSHFRFGNHWFPRFRTKVTYLKDHTFSIQDESSYQVEIPVNPATLDQVFSYLENILVLGQHQSWSNDWMPPPLLAPVEEAKKKDPLPIGTPVCAMDCHGRWYLGSIADIFLNDKAPYIIKWDKSTFPNEAVYAPNVVPRLQQPIQEPKQLVGRTVLVDHDSHSLTRLTKIEITSLMEDKLTGQLIFMASDNVVFKPEKVRGILP